MPNMKSAGEYARLAEEALREYGITPESKEAAAARAMVYAHLARTAAENPHA